MHSWLLPFWGIVQLNTFFSTFNLGDVDVVKVLDTVTVSSVALVFAAKYIKNVDLAHTFKSTKGEVFYNGYIAIGQSTPRKMRSVLEAVSPLLQWTSKCSAFLHLAHAYPSPS